MLLVATVPRKGIASITLYGSRIRRTTPANFYPIEKHARSSASKSTLSERWVES